MFAELLQDVGAIRRSRQQITTFLEEADGLSNSTSVPTTTQSPCASLTSCAPEDLKISAVILTISLLAFLENLVLLVAVMHWKLSKSCRMFWFLWHLSLADVVLALTFAFFHLRVLTSCPIPHSCMPNYQAESIILLVMFFSTIGASHLFVLAATVDRFIAIKWSLRYADIVTTRSTRVVAACIWICSFFFPIIGALGILLWNPMVSYSVTTLVCASMCLLSAAGVIVLNVWLVCYAWSRMRNAPTTSAVSRTRPSTSSSFPDLSAFQDSVKLTVTLALFVGSFLLSCAPWSVALIVCEEAHSCAAKQNQDYTLVLVLFHALIIPVLYGFRVEEVKRRVIKFWKDLLPRNDGLGDGSCCCCRSHS